MLEMSLLDIIARLPALVIGIVCHEGAHALTADRLGDPTPQKDGRLTLDPRAHLTQLGTLFIIFGPFGWGRSVRYDPSRFYSPIRGSAKVAFAGPLASMLVATFSAVIYSALYGSTMATSILAKVLLNLVFLNTILAFFNLLPFGSFDGNKVLAALSPKMAKKLSRISISGCAFLLIILFFFKELVELILLPAFLVLSLSLQGGLLVNLMILLFFSLTAWLFVRSIKNPEESFAISFRKLLTIVALCMGLTSWIYGAIVWRSNFIANKNIKQVEHKIVQGHGRVMKKEGSALSISVYDNLNGTFEATIDAADSELSVGDETKVFYRLDDFGRPTNVSLKEGSAPSKWDGHFVFFALGLVPFLLAHFLFWPGSDNHFGRAEVLEDGVTIQGQFRVLSSTTTKKDKKQGREPN